MFEIPLGLQPLAQANSFFDWASISPSSRAAVEARSRSLQEVVRRADAPQQLRRQTEALELLRHELRKFLGACGLEASIVLGRSVSELMSVLAFGIPGIDRESRVVLFGAMHPSVVLSWRAAAEHAGAGLVHLELGQEQDYRADGVRVVVLTHVDHISGSELDIAPVVEWSHQNGAIVIVDGAQSVGRVPVNLVSTRPDVYIASGRKALLAPMGTAFMVVSEKLLAEVRPSLWSTRSATLREDGTVAIGIGTKRLEGNLPDLSALAGLEANIRLWTPEVASMLVAHVDHLLPRLMERMQDVGLEQRLGLPGTRNAGILTFDLPKGWDGLALQSHLIERGIVVAATQTDVRISMHFANQLDDIERLVEAVRCYAA